MFRCPSSPLNIGKFLRKGQPKFSWKIDKKNKNDVTQPKIISYSFV